MGIVINAVVGLHVIGIAALLGGFFYQMKAMRAGEARFVPGMLHGALTMLATGLALVGLNEAAGEAVDHIKISVKLAVVVAILLLVNMNRDEEKVSTRVFGAVGALTVVNVFIAVLWT